MSESKDFAMAYNVNLGQLAAQLAQLAAALATQVEKPNPPRPAEHLPARVLLTVEEAAERLGIGRTMAFQLVRSGQLESVHIGRLRRIPVSAVDEYAEALVRNVRKAA